MICESSILYLDYKILVVLRKFIGGFEIFRRNFKSRKDAILAEKS
jgi:hypothetical protein